MLAHVAVNWEPSGAEAGETPRVAADVGVGLGVDVRELGC